MDWFTSLFTVHSSIQTVVIISVIIAVGLALGKIRVMGISLGIAFVFFAGIVAGNIGMSIDGVTLDYAETFGLSMFVYCLGLHVGPNFFGSLRHEGMMLNVWSLAVIILGTAFALVLSPLTGISIPVMTGLLCGATTNTPALGAATQALAHAGLSSSDTALATAVTYPLGVVGVIIAMVLIRKFFVKPTDLEVKKLSDDNHTYIAQFTAINPAIIGRTIQQIAQMTHVKFIISRIWRGKQVIVPVATTELHVNDKLLVVTNKEDEQAMTLLFGKKENDLDWNKEDIDWNAIDANVESRVCVITRPSLNGKHLGALHMRQAYGVNVSRVIRGDIKLLASDDLRLEYGDRITIVGKHENLDNAEHFFGNSVKTLEEPNIGSIFLGIVLGLILGSIPLSLPGMESPIRLGIAGGPIIMGIIVGALGPRLHLISYTTRSLDSHQARGSRLGGHWLPYHTRAHPHHRYHRSQSPSLRLWNHLRHSLRQHGQPHGTGLRQRYAQGRHGKHFLRFGLSPGHVHPSRHCPDDHHVLCIGPSPACRTGVRHVEYYGQKHFIVNLQSREDENVKMASFSQNGSLK